MQTISEMRIFFYSLIALFILVGCSSSNSEDQEVKTVIESRDVVLQIEEHPLKDTVIGNVKATTNNGTLIYTLLTVNPQGAIRIDSNNGDILVVEASLFEYDENPTITANVRLTNGEIDKDVEITIDLIEVAEKIVVSVNDFEITVDENPWANQILGILNATTNSGEVVFSLDSATPEGAIEVDSSTGELKVSDSNAFDYESNPIVSAVIIGENNGVIDSSVITINLRDLDEEMISFSKIEVNGRHFSGRTGMRAVTFKDKLWLLGGFDGDDPRDVWSTSDGATWEKVGNFGIVNTSGFQARVTVFKDRLWIAHSTSSTPLAIRSSSDGVSWQEEIPSGVVFPSGVGYEIVVFQDKLWLLGGGVTSHVSGVWSSSDGIEWTEEVTTGTEFAGLTSFQTVVFNDKIFVIGGRNVGLGTVNSIWSSTDGINWNQEISKGNTVPKRLLHQAVVFEDKIWLIGGYSGETKEYLNDVWISVDGVNWEKATVEGEHFSPRAYHASAIFNSSLWVIGGRFEDGPRLNDIWRMD